MSRIFEFHGNIEEREYLLASDGRRGDTALTIEPGHDLKPGDKVCLRALDTERWLREVNNFPTEFPVWGRRVNQYLVRTVDGDTLALTQPLRIDYPVIDGSCLRRVRAVERCGIEDLSIKHVCRMDDTTWYRYRHGPIVQFGAQGNVIRNMLKDDAKPLLQLKTADCVGVELIDNTLVGGNGKIYEGVPPLETERGNRALPCSADVPDRPVTDLPSIFEWQQKHCRRN